MRDLPGPGRLGWWPAAAGMLAFSWVALVLPGRPVTLLVFLLLYGLAQLGAALVYGQAWFARGEALEAYSTVLGSMAPVTRDAAGRLALANPRTRLADSRPAPGLLGVAAVVIGANLFDAILESDAWHGLALGATQEVVGTAVLAACVLVTYAVAAAVVRRRGLVPALLPAAAAGPRPTISSPSCWNGARCCRRCRRPLRCRCSPRPPSACSSPATSQRSSWATTARSPATARSPPPGRNWSSGPCSSSCCSPR